MRAERVSTRTLHTGRIFRLDEDRIRFSDGSETVMDMVRHPGASAIVPFLSDPRGEDPQVLLLRQYRWAAESVIYEIPAGRLNPGEQPADCALRELREETGCQAGRVEHVFTMFTTPGFTDETIHLFYATDLVAATTDGRDDDEFITTETMPLSRALEMVRDGTIRDAKTALALLYVAGFVAGRERPATTALHRDAYAVANGVSSERLCGVKSSAPFSVMTMSSSKRMPNSPGM
jgi:ADP-ribose pyrophosphatase